MIIEYIRKNGQLVGCVVGLNHDGQIGVGVSLCNSKDKFDKKFGKTVAIERAKNSIQDESKAFPGWSDKNGRHEWIPESKKQAVEEVYEKMIQRCSRLYKEAYL